MTWQERKKVAEERAKTLHDMQAILDKAQEETRDLSDEESGTFDKMNQRAEEIGRQLERYDRLIDLQTRSQSEPEPDQKQERSEPAPGREDVEPDQAPREQRDEQARIELRAFGQFLRRGRDAIEETRALTTSGQGVVGIRPFNATLFDQMKSYAGVRQAGAEIIPTSHGNEMVMPTGDDTSNTGRLVGEGDTNSTETNPTLGNVKLSAFKFSSDWIKVSHELLQDADYDIEGYIQRKAAQRIGRSINTYTTTGTGTGQPQGIVTAAGVGKTAAATDAITYEELLDLIHSVDAAYRAEPGFGLMLHDTTLSAIRKLKDGSGRYIWSAGAAGAPDQILSYRYTVNNSMAQLDGGADSRVILAADFGRYVVRDVTMPVIIRAIEKFADDGLVGFQVMSRHDGRLGDTTAAKALALAAS